MNTTINQVLELFGVVTVMDVHVYKLNSEKLNNQFKHTYGTKTLSTNDFTDTNLCIDTLKISNIKQSAPKKTFPIGIFNVPGIQAGKNVSIEIQDVLGRKKVLKYFFGMNMDDAAGIYSINANFGSLLCLEGYTWVVDLNGNKQMLWITIPCFSPKSAW